jgi:hypothetical protein
MNAVCRARQDWTQQINIIEWLLLDSRELGSHKLEQNFPLSTSTWMDLIEKRSSPSVVSTAFD